MMKSFDSKQRLLLGSIGFIEFLRILGIFLILPTFTLYGEKFSSSPLLIGAALGAYGIAMALFQTLFGNLSDRFGRKKIIAIGTIPFIVGNLLCWSPSNIIGLIAGRFISGSGAISSTGFAFVQESVPVQKRNLAMAVIGIPIGIASVFGILIGPVISQIFGSSFIFLLSAILGVASLVPLIKVKEEKKPYEIKSRQKATVSTLLMGGIGFTASFLVMVVFFFLPLYISNTIGISRYYTVLLPTLLVGGIIGLSLSRLGDRGKSVMASFITLVLFLSSVFLLFYLPVTTGIRLLFYIGLTLFFAGYALFEIVFITLVTKLSPSGSYGSNIGIYSTLQYIGEFLGGAVGGTLLSLTLTPATTFRTSLLLALLVLISIGLLYSATRQIGKDDRIFTP
ncbi:MFS transporter [Oxyplasma meridianum]|uniref:MFS transporter n=1 Tax=Oxyplasma meridianum TaxID=3073602 RepID=A0AAX4NG93_9ARCH